MTRMWCVPPRMLCRNHLLGEHKELHQLVGSINAGHENAVRGLIRDSLVQLDRIDERHEELVAEMVRRGYNHQSPIDVPEHDYPTGEVNVGHNGKDLVTRCAECRNRFHLLMGWNSLGRPEGVEVL